VTSSTPYGLAQATTQHEQGEIAAPADVSVDSCKYQHHASRKQLTSFKILNAFFLPNVMTGLGTVAITVPIPKKSLSLRVGALSARVTVDGFLLLEEMLVSECLGPFLFEGDVLKRGAQAMMA